MRHGSPRSSQPHRKLIQRSAYFDGHRQQRVSIDHQSPIASQVGMTSWWKGDAISIGLVFVRTGQHVERRRKIGGIPRHRPADPEPACQVSR